MASMLHPHSNNVRVPGKRIDDAYNLFNGAFLNMPISKTDIPIEPVVILDVNQPIEEGYKIVSTKLAAPVFDKTKNQFVGIVDIKHFLGYILYKMPFPPTGVEEKHTISELLMFPCYVLDKNSTICELFKYFNTGVHSAFILNEKKQIQMISQMSLIRWIREHINEIGIGGQSIGHLVKDDQIHKFSKVFSIDEKEPVVNALKIIYTENIYGMPILRDDRVVGNISVVDLTLAQDNLDKLTIPLSLFFKDRPVFTCWKNSTLIDVLDKMIEHNVHRLHVVEGDNLPYGIITISDIVHVMLEQSGFNASQPTDNKMDQKVTQNEKEIQKDLHQQQQNKKGRASNIDIMNDKEYLGILIFKRGHVLTDISHNKEWERTCGKNKISSLNNQYICPCFPFIIQSNRFD
ncbi:hypothetical protein DFA_05187 [Cavenderia fasciculata]|uniref:CBS domain-containing protein n=1 Tax=Cavenderia fasciculata TaxID=261658 RepID=F4PNK4_CACFS|nr:uncharacterized protein DFA_05187 [Cavenderia fasciculata]EGG23057.1 hypothetical protein DFA_05187 [Cavenderia fasciculata]|eukprot:XP_004360908.1 hypothetical protein DFA_05187 [Cavenderia fasciculata]